MSRHVLAFVVLFSTAAQAGSTPKAALDPALRRAIVDMPLPSVARRLDAQGAPLPMTEVIARLARELRLDLPADADLLAARR